MTGESVHAALNALLLSADPGYRSAGLHRYILGLAGGLAEVGATVTAITAGRAPARLLPPSVATRVAPRALRLRSLRIGWEQVLLPAVAARTGAAVLHGPAHALPVASPLPGVVTVHDLSFFRLPDTFPPLQGAYLRLATRSAVRRARGVIAVSAFTRSELGRVLGVPEHRVDVIPNGIDAALSPAAPDDVASLRHQLDLPANYLLTVGTLQPRKNLGVLLEAYALLAARRPAAPHLVVAGGTGWGDTDVTGVAARLGIAGRVHVTGYVDGRDLAPLYSGASAFALPSRYEGFGLPALEAMACGVPTVVAAAGALPEVVGGAALTADPDAPEEWADALERLLDDGSATGLRSRGQERARGFSWHAAARATVSVYEAAAAGDLAREVPDGA